MNGGVLLLILAVLAGLVINGRRRQRARLAQMRALAHQDKLATIGTLAASVAHEIRNAITIAELNLQLAGQETTGQVRQDIDEASGAVERLGELARSLSDYAGKDRETFERFELSEVVDEALRIVHPKLAVDTTIETELAASLPVYGVKSALIQLLVNLLLNAAEASPSGAQVSVYLEVGGDMIHLVVDDDGPGIPDDLKRRIFEPFFSTKGDDTEGGTGLGLWLCAQMADQHGGTLTAGDADGGGARFALELPVAADEEHRRDAA